MYSEELSFMFLVYTIFTCSVAVISSIYFSYASYNYEGRTYPYFEKDLGYRKVGLNMIIFVFPSMFSVSLVREYMGKRELLPSILLLFIFLNSYFVMHRFVNWQQMYAFGWVIAVASWLYEKRKIDVTKNEYTSLSRDDKIKYLMDKNIVVNTNDLGLFQYIIDYNLRRLPLDIKMDFNDFMKPKN